MGDNVGDSVGERVGLKVLKRYQEEKKWVRLICL